ncbi:MAG: hypothetical protein MSS75_09045, partial [Megasphaera sp.]|uniref:hypothetical protein n=1 Tax=Megasphaera sp. TaxID=2023260 RepID=UPI0025BB80C8
NNCFIDTTAIIVIPPVFSSARSSLIFTLPRWDRHSAELAKRVYLGLGIQTFDIISYMTSKGKHFFKCLPLL